MAVLMCMSMQPALAHANIHAPSFSTESRSSAASVASIAEAPSNCMNLTALKIAVDKAAWVTTSASGVERKFVILTSCNDLCLKEMFSPWMEGLQQARNGNGGDHVIVISHGVQALTVCMQHKRSHPKLQCMLDRFCMPKVQQSKKLEGQMAFKSPVFAFACFRKMQWATMFPGDAERWDFKTTPYPRPNGGFWFANPTEGAMGLMNVWYYKYFKILMVDGVFSKSFDGDFILESDQGVLKHIMRNNVRNATTYSSVPDKDGVYVELTGHRMPVALLSVEQRDVTGDVRRAPVRLAAPAGAGVTASTR
eukprot:gene13519-19384_t